MTVYKVEKDGGGFRICFSINVEREIETDTNSFPCETILTLSGLLELKCLDLLRYFSYYFLLLKRQYRQSLVWKKVMVIFVWLEIK